jgi:transposase
MRTHNQVILPLDLEIKIPENDPVKKLAEICEELDYTELNEVYQRDWRKYDTLTMFELLVYGYMNRIYSSRGIEEACRRDICFMWILQGKEPPDHATIARFQNERLVKSIEGLFYQFVGKLIELGEITFKNMFVDGTKIEANANRYTFVWRKAVEKNRAKAREKIEPFIRRITETYGFDCNMSAEECYEALLNRSQWLNTHFVSGKGNHKTQLQRDIEILSEYMEKDRQYAEHIRRCGRRNSYSKTDTDATFMRMKEDHMRNGQLKPGYNVQIGVASEYIIGFGAFSNPTDVNTLIPFLERIYHNTYRRFERVVADAGYESEENYTYLEEHGQKAFIKPSDYEIRKTKKYKSDAYRVDNMYYDEEKDVFYCVSGEEFRFVYETSEKSPSGYELKKRIYRTASCEGCPERGKCYRGTKPYKEIKVSSEFMKLRELSYENIKSDEGIILRMNRSIQVEGVFGVLKEDYSFRRFLIRGKEKIETQFFLLAFAFNVQKLCNRINSERFGSQLFIKESA